MTMTCADAAARIDGFVDGELNPSLAIDVARHLGQCRPCDASVQRLLAIREALADTSARAVDQLDLSGVWAQVDRAIGKVEGQQKWRDVGRDRAAAKRGVLPRRLAWGAAAAIAAGTVLFLRPVGGPGTIGPVAPAAQVAKAGAQGQLVKVESKRLPNHVYIDRLAGKDIALRREPKSGTTMIWVNHEVERNGW
jgi:anti-sigma factor RsiW